MNEKVMRRTVRWGGIISIVPAVYLPFYNTLLHGGRDAASIVTRSGDYAEVHMIAGLSAAFVVFGLLGIFLRIGERTGPMGLLAFMAAATAQILYAGELFIDGFFNPMLAHYDPVLQTHLHSAQYMSTPIQLLGGAFFFVPFATFVLIFGYGLFAFAILRSGCLPWTVGAMLGIAGVLLGTALFEQQAIETIGYALLGIALLSGTFAQDRVLDPVASRKLHA